ncbi:MAG: MATE family efflux transporter [Planctomycetes bacterium]|nr:MATE family efflux transporter [Planctomycetota bacterium]
MDSRVKEIGRYVIPSVSSMVVTFAYAVVDGMFVGRGVGANALAAVNIALPFNIFLLAAAYLIITGAATVFAIRTGRGDRAGANTVFNASGVLVIAVSALFAAIGVFWPERIAILSGASEALMENTVTYLRYYCMFSVIWTLSTWLAVFVRNDGRPSLAFWGMVAGAIANIFLDWLFVFPLQMGVKGAAVASGLGQVLSFAILATHLIGNRGVLRVRLLKPSLALVGKIVKRGVPEMITQLYHPLTVFCYNLVIIRTVGEDGIAAFSIITYIAAMFIGIFSGVSQGIQPLLGQSFGRNEHRNVTFYFRAGLVLNVVLSFSLYLAMVFGGGWLYGFFTTDPGLISLAEMIWKYNALAFVFASVNIVFTTYFFSTKQTPSAVVTAGCRGLLFNTICIFTFPLLFPADYVWFAIVASEVATIAIAMWMKNRASAALAGEICPAPVVVTSASGRYSNRFAK